MARPNPIPPHEYNHLAVEVFFNKSHHNQQDNAPASISNNQHQSHSVKICLRARVIYLSHTHLDVALLQVEEGDRELVSQHLQPVKKSLSVETRIGMPVWVVANGFGPDQGMDLICSYGLIANTILREGIPASLQTSASVHSGNSGGLLVNSEGELMGMVMSNASHKGTRTFTQLNFAIPYHQFITLINFANGEDPLAIQRLQNQPTDNFLASLWKFQGEPKEAPKTGQNFRKFVEQMKNTSPSFPTRSKL